MFDIITIGDSMVDTFVVIDHDEATLQCNLKQDRCQLCIDYADKIPIKHTHQAIGGNAANVAVGCQKLGLKTTILTELGDDLNGLSIVHDLEAQKVNTALIKIIPKAETRYSIILNYLAERTVLAYFVKRNYTLPKLPDTRWIYYTSLAKNFEKLQDQLVKYLKNHPQTKLAINPGTYQMKYNLKKIKQILPLTEIIFINKEEAVKIIGKEKNLKETIKKLHQLGIKKVVITDSVRGAYASDGKNIYQMPIFPIHAVDKTGAGDAFASGFLSALMHEQNLTEALKWGTANSAGVITKIGAQEGLMNKQAIIKMISRFKKIEPNKLKN